MKHFRNQLGEISLDNKDHLKNPYPKGFTKVEVPAGISGDWQVTKMQITDENVGLYNLRLIRDGMRHRIIPPGDYTRLSFRNSVVMTDTPAEAWEHRDLYHAAHGRVLVNGLGLGFALKAILSKPEVQQVHIIELSEDVIKLVAPSYKDARVTIEQADARVWRPGKGKRFDVVWHDIWTDISEDNKAEITALKRAYARRAGWQGAWSTEYL